MSITAIDIQTRGPLLGGQSFGEWGPYEYLKGSLSFAVDPEHPANQRVCDIGLAPRDSSGRVTFTADFYLLKPVQPRPENRLLYDVLNRGNKIALARFNNSPPAADPAQEIPLGDGYLMRQGISVLWSGIQCDVPDSPGTLMQFQAPEALENGQRITGQAFVQYWPNRPTQVQRLADAMHQPLPAADVNDPAATLTVREHHDAPAAVIDRSEWQFARAAEGAVLPDPNFVYLASGFQPGKVYEITYTSIGAKLTGLGLVSMRDAASFFRYGSGNVPNPLDGAVRHAYGFGQSMSGRFVREFLYEGFNQDEAGRQVFDGLMIHTGSSRRGEFNFRFSQPSTNILRAPGNRFPFTYTEQGDPVTGQHDGLLARAIASNTLPKVIAMNSGMEYWWSGASLTHTDIAGTVDVDPPEDVRIYYMSGTQHTPGTLPLRDTTPDGFKALLPLNTVDYNPLVRAALANLDRWVSDGTPAPPSQHPRLDNATAATRESLEAPLTSIPGVPFLSAVPPRARLDFGPSPDQPAYPPAEGEPYAVLVSALDADGNEVAGVRLPDILVPLATYHGWNMRAAEMGQPGLMTAGAPLFGFTLPFPRTSEERAATGDPRRPIAERYASKDDYLAQVRQAAEAMVQQGYLLAEDVDGCIKGADQRWDAFLAWQPPPRH